MSNNWIILIAKLTYFMQYAIIIQIFFLQKGLGIPKNDFNKREREYNVFIVARRKLDISVIQTLD
jgi:hypothetical protein